MRRSGQDGMAAGRAKRPKRPRRRLTVSGYGPLKQLKPRKTLKFLRSVARALLVSGRITPYTSITVAFPKISESMGNHDSKIVDAGSVD
jgi:hypothetical protein